MRQSFVLIAETPGAWVAGVKQKGALLQILIWHEDTETHRVQSTNGGPAIASTTNHTSLAAAWTASTGVRLGAKVGR